MDGGMRVDGVQPPGTDRAGHHPGSLWWPARQDLLDTTRACWATGRQQPAECSRIILIRACFGRLFLCLASDRSAEPTGRACKNAPDDTDLEVLWRGKPQPPPSGTDGCKNTAAPHG